VEPNKDLKKLLEASSKEGLIHFLLALAKESDEVTQRLELKFGDNNDDDELQQCEELIDSYIRLHSDKHGFVSYGVIRNAITGAGIVLGRAQDYLEDHNYIQAVKLCLVVIHEMIELMESADDSAGYIGGTITDSLGLIGTVFEDEAAINTAEKGILFEILIKETTNEIYEEWTEWSFELLNICVSLADTSDRRNVLESCFEELLQHDQEGSWRADRLIEQITNLRYDLILKYDGEDQAAEFTRSNLNISSFREREIKAEIAAGNYTTAEQLATEGELKDNEWRGLVFKWKQLRYEVYKLSHQLDKQQNLAVEFVLDNIFKYYEELKLTYTPIEWSQTYPHLLDRIERNKTTYQEVYTQILVEEKEWAKLLEHVKKSPSRIVSFYKYLATAFPNEVYELFNLHIEFLASKASSRKDYQNVTNVIRTFKKAGKDAPTQEIVRKLLDLYARKPAFQDELSKI
jgi:hypothetical protein